MRYYQSLIVSGDRVTELARDGSNVTQSFSIEFDNSFSMEVSVQKDSIHVSLFDSSDTRVAKAEIPGTVIDQTYTLTNNDDTYQFAIGRGAHAFITQPDIRQYCKAGGLYCPFCRSTDIHAGRFRAQDDGIAVQPVECVACGATWKDEYKLIQIVTSGEDVWTGPTENVICNDDGTES